MLDYNGSLLYSIHGFGDHTPGQYSYPAGVSGFGTLFQVRTEDMHLCCGHGLEVLERHRHTTYL